MEKKSFILYTNYFEILKDLSDSDLGIMFRAILSYQTNGEYNIPKHLELAFKFIKNQLDIDEVKYNDFIEKQRQNGKLGGRPKTQKTQKTQPFSKKPKKPKLTQKSLNDNVNVNENDNVNVNENVKEKEIKKEKDSQAQQPPAVVPSKPIKPHQRLYNYFAAKYKQATGIDYLGKSQDFVALATLEKKFGIDMVKQKIDWFYIGCKNAVFWFTKDINDFVIGKLQSHWNEIIPKLTEEQKQQQKENEEREKHKAQLRARGIEC